MTRNVQKPHVCAVCGHEWKSPDEKTKRDVIAAAKVNKQGPFCLLCLYLEMAFRVATHRGYGSLAAAVEHWEHGKREKEESNESPEVER